MDVYKIIENAIKEKNMEYVLIGVILLLLAAVFVLFYKINS